MRFVQILNFPSDLKRVRRLRQEKMLLSEELRVCSSFEERIEVREQLKKVEKDLYDTVKN